MDGSEAGRSGRPEPASPPHGCTGPGGPGGTGGSGTCSDAEGTKPRGISGRQIAYGLALVVLVVIVSVALWRRFPELKAFLAKSEGRPNQTTGTGVVRYLFPTALGLVALVCLAETWTSLRYRGVGRWMAVFAAAATVADLATSSVAGRTGSWPPYVPAVKWALAPVPVLFALGILIARTFWRPFDKTDKVDPNAVREGIEWAVGQVDAKQKSDAARRFARMWDWTLGRPPTAPNCPPRTPVATTKTGVCFSGGGIRSAAFNLGALQELQAAGELHRADVLSAVSGGSYMAGAWALTATCSEPAALESAPPFAPGTPEEQYLRNRTTYLVPDLPGFCAVLWRLVRGLAVNIAFVGLVVFLVARPYGWAMHERFRLLCPVRAKTCPVAGPFHEAGTAGVVLLVLVALAVGAGLLDLMLRPRGSVSNGTEAWSLRLAGLALLLAVTWFVLPWAAAGVVRAPYRPPSAAGFGALSTLGTGLLVLVRLSGSRGSVRDRASSMSTTMQRLRDGARKLGDGTLRILLIVVGGIIGPLAFLAGILMAATGAMASGRRVAGVAVWLLLLSVFVLFEGVSDANRWSLQPFYKRRLQTAFGLVRQGQGDQARASEIDYHTRLEFTRLLDVPKLVVCAAVNLDDYGLLPPGRPVSTFTFSREKIDAGALGEVATRAFGALLGPEYARDFTVPAAQGASGAAFSPVMGKLTNHSARFVFALLNLRLGVWLPNPQHVARWAAKQAPPQRRKGPDTAGLKAAHKRALGALDQARQAARDSRAAMLNEAELLAGDKQRAHLAKGSREQAALQAKVFSARREAERLRKEIDDTQYPQVPASEVDFKGFPHFPRPSCLFRELFGRFRSTSRFVYVTDGGHYECLGLVELLRRGCKWIYCFDASGDQTDAFNTIGDAVAIARVELGVLIELDPTKLAPRERGGFNQGLHTVGKVIYPGHEEDPGHIVFVKLGMTADVPSDVRAWQRAHPRFPTDGTGDQLYTNQRFEAYRVLGCFSATGAIEAMRKHRGENPLGASGPLRPTAPTSAAATPPTSTPTGAPVRTNAKV